MRKYVVEAGARLPVGKNQAESGRRYRGIDVICYPGIRGKIRKGLLIKYNMPRDNDSTAGKIKATIPFLFARITQENATGGSRS